MQKYFIVSPYYGTTWPVVATDDKNTYILMTYICDINNLPKLNFLFQIFFNIFFVS